MGHALALESRQVEDVVASVRGACSHLVDAWEATALIESFGYTDARVKRELGFPDTRALGSYVFELLEQRPRATPVIDDEDEMELERVPHADFLESATSSLIYAVPWLVTFIAERVRPDALRLPGHAAPPLSIALMLSLIISGGFIQAITRRGQFYIGMKQYGLASLVCQYLFRLGAAATVAVALGGLFIGWYFTLFAWPYLLLGADQFVILSLLWMTFGVLSTRRQHWRVPLAFAAGAATFIAMRATGRDALLSELVASGAMLAAALAQIPSVFAVDPDEALDEVPLPRMTVVLYQVLPFFWYGTVYFCFLFADRFAASASAAALTGAPFGLRPEYKLGMDVALLTFLLASAGTEYANLQFTRMLAGALRATSLSAVPALVRALRLIHVRALGIVVAVFAPVAVLVEIGSRRLLPDAPHSVWSTVILGDIGYLLLCVGLLNALVLFSLNRPWMALRALTAGLVVNVAVGYISSHLFDTYLAAAGLIAGAGLVAVLSSIAVHATLTRADHAVAV